MFSNYFKSIFREFGNNKFLSLIKIPGLSFGVACAVVIISLVMNLLSFDNFHLKGDRIYTAFTKSTYKTTGERISATMTAKLGPALKEEIPEVRNTATVTRAGEVLFIVNNNKIKRKGIRSEESLFSIFSFPITSRTGNYILEPGSVALSESLAEILFGNRNNAPGKTVLIRENSGRKEYIVSCIFKDVPENSSLKFDFVLPLEEKINENPAAYDWGNSFADVYIEVNKNIEINQLNYKLKNFITRHNPYSKEELFLYRYDNVVLDNPQAPLKVIIVIKILLFIGIAILLIACINYINIAVSQSVKKAKEVGLRKMAGAGRVSLIFRFLGESFVTTLLSVMLSLFIAEIIISIMSESFAEIIRMHIPFENTSFLGVLLLMTIILTIISGLYPAVYLSSFSPIKVIKGTTGTGNKTFTFRKILIVFQFIASSMFIVVAIIIHEQIKYIRTKDLGLDIKAIVSFELPESIREHAPEFKRDLAAITGIKDFTFANSLPIGVYNSTSSPWWEGKPQNLNDQICILQVDENFAGTFNIKVKKGRSFAGLFDDMGNFLINEQMAALMRKDNPVGEKLSFWKRDGIITGVINDFHIQDFNYGIKPLIIILDSSKAYNAFIKASAGQLPSVIPELKSIFEKYEKDYPFEYSFLDEDFVKNYKDIEILEGLAGIFSSFSIIISCLGLFGLTALTVNQKTKEIGIRKVLGSSVAGIVSLLSKQMMILIITAFCISVPFSYIIMKEWLQIFAYRTDAGLRVFVFSFITVIGIAFLTIISLAVKAAKANPVESLKYE